MVKRNIGLIIFWLIFIISFVFVYSEAYKNVQFDYLKEMILAFMAASVTILITALLLRQQTNSEELKDTHSEIFKKKFEVYEAFFEQLILLNESGVHHNNTLRKLEESLYKVLLFSQQPDTIDKLQDVILNGLQSAKHNKMSELINTFREELGIHDSTTTNKQFAAHLEQKLILITTAIESHKM